MNGGEGFAEMIAFAHGMESMFPGLDGVGQVGGVVDGRWVISAEVNGGASVRVGEVLEKADFVGDRGDEVLLLDDPVSGSLARELGEAGISGSGTAQGVDDLGGEFGSGEEGEGAAEAVAGDPEALWGLGREQGGEIGRQLAVGSSEAAMDLAAGRPDREQGVEVVEPMLEIGGAAKDEDLMARLIAGVNERPVELSGAVVSGFFEASLLEGACPSLGILDVDGVAEPGEDQCILECKGLTRNPLGQGRRQSQVCCGLKDSFPQLGEAFFLGGNGHGGARGPI